MDGAPVVGIAVVNPHNGVGPSLDPAYLEVIRHAQQRGIRVLGYVYTSYGNRPAQEVQSEISRYFQWYAVDGIFLDEASDDCLKAGYYTGLRDHIKGFNPGKLVVLNHGLSPGACYAEAGDILIVFEGKAADYYGWEPDPWIGNYETTKFWHLIYEAHPEDLANILSLARQRNAGWIYVTEDAMPNPWDRLPDPEQWAQQLRALGLVRTYLPLVIRP